jgi:hypothetical protein
MGASASDLSIFSCRRGAPLSLVGSRPRRWRVQAISTSKIRSAPAIEFIPSSEPSQLLLEDHIGDRKVWRTPRGDRPVPFMALPDSIPMVLAISLTTGLIALATGSSRSCQQRNVPRKSLIFTARARPIRPMRMTANDFLPAHVAGREASHQTRGTKATDASSLSNALNSKFEIATSTQEEDDCYDGGLDQAG